MQRVQTLRSAITGWRPPAGTRQPGELYVNWADAAFGTINVAQAAMDLIAVRFFSAQANYAAGSHVIYNGVLYKALGSITAGAFNPAQWASIVVGGVTEAPLDGQLYGRKSAAWVVVPSGGGGGIPEAPTDGAAYARKNAAWTRALPLSGGVMTGAITLPGPPVNPTDAADKAYVDAAVAGGGGGGGGGGANLIDNGDMSVQQRGNATLAVTSGGHILLDRWAAYATASRYTIGQNYNGLPPPPGFATFLGAQCTSATAVGSSDYFALQQAIEGATLNGFNWGAAGAQPVTLSFWACSSLGGTFSGALNNGANNRSYVFTFPLAASTPTFVTLTIPGDIAGTWNNLGLNAELFLVFDLGSGAGNRTSTTNAWVNGAFVGQTGAAGIIGVNGATFYVTGVKLELGSVATPFAYDPPAVRLVRCQRYFQIIGQVGCDGYGGQGFMSGVQTLVCQMRAAPTVTVSNITYNNASAYGVFGTSENTIVVGANTSGSGDSYANAIAALSSEI